MSRFTALLSDLETRLTVPEPARSRVLLEVAADVDDLYTEYLGRGLSEADAEAAAADHFDLSEEALRDLIRVHDTPVQRSLEQLSGHVRGTWSTLLMGILVLFVVAGSGRLMVQRHLYEDASRLVWALMPIFFVGLFLAGRAVRRLGFQGHGRRADGGWGLGHLLSLAPLILGLAVSGLWVELYRSALLIRSFPREAFVYLVGWLHMASATLVIALSAALVLGFLWFFLESWVRRRELMAVADLLGEG